MTGNRVTEVELRRVNDLRAQLAQRDARIAELEKACEKTADVLFDVTTFLDRIRGGNEDAKRAWKILWQARTFLRLVQSGDNERNPAALASAPKAETEGLANG